MNEKYKALKKLAHLQHRRSLFARHQIHLRRLAQPPPQPVAQPHQAAVAAHRRIAVHVQAAHNAARAHRIPHAHIRIEDARRQSAQAPILRHVHRQLGHAVQRIEQAAGQLHDGRAMQAHRQPVQVAQRLERIGANRSDRQAADVQQAQLAVGVQARHQLCIEMHLTGEWRLGSAAGGKGWRRRCGRLQRRRRRSGRIFVMVVGTGAGAVASHQVQLFQAEQLDETVPDLRSQRDVQHAQHPQLRPEARAVAVLTRLAGGTIAKADHVQAIEVSDGGDFAAAGWSGVGGWEIL